MHLCMIFILFCLLRSSNADYQLNDDEYERMPPLVSLDHFHRCLRRPGGRFCSAYATFVADGDSPLLTMMKEYSQFTSTRFNHTRAFFGKCISLHCQSEKEDTKSDPRHLLEGCLNRTVWDEYKLKVKLEEDVNCNEHGETKLKVKTADVIVAAILLGLVMCNVVGSLFDIYYPKTWTQGFVSQFLLCFSITRNWNMLTAPPDPKLENLKGIYGIRAISMTLVIIAHGLLPNIVGPENPKFIEDLYDMSVFHILLNGTVIMQTFLFLSAFLMIYFYQLRGIQLSWRNLVKGLAKRWLRLTLPYAVVLAVTATWLPFTGTGPIWDSMMVKECESCRHNWWQHILYINNYFDDTLCMRQTWYLAADTQLYCLGLAVYIFCRTPRSRNVVLSALFFISLVIPALHTYYQDLDGLLLASPSAGASLFTTDRTFNMLYKRGHTNLSGFVLGMSAGYLAHSLQKNNFNIQQYRAWRPVYWLLFPLFLIIPISCKVFYVTPRVHILYRTLTAALLKPVFGVIVGTIILGMIFKLESVYRGVVEWRGWVPLSRVSYCAYLLHGAYIRATCSSLDHPLRLSYLRACEMVLFTVTMVYIGACLFWLTVEAPLSRFVNKFTDSVLWSSGGRQEKMNKKID